ncbi:hypothetical protein Pcinc_027808 [Petrolisthes cinctipes]|uniref:Uncharacterized protein n=1 Tax=Petrolisthes cinctipes TaxID=88211 RepID=A0AAE1F4Y1_PETCI|nr:hypothetical protein Pcinc_027808 [Petrolisthes cinctipes]
MISQEDYDVITGVEAGGNARQTLLHNQRYQVARTFMNLLGHISKDQTIQYILILVDDTLSEDKSRVEMLKEYTNYHHESIWRLLFSLLAHSDIFITFISACIIAKLACWSVNPLEGSDLTLYLTWLKD